MKIIDKILILLLLFGISSCVEKYWPEIDKYENVLVVNGLLTNGDDPVVITLSTSTSINNDKFIPLGGGQITISDEDQNDVELTEVSPGTYQVLDSNFHGQIGNSYQLHITLPDGRNYISEICELHEPLPIDSVYGIVEPQISTYDGSKLLGMQFFINFQHNTTDTSFYLWKLSQTFEYKSSFNIDWVWQGYYVEFPDPDSLRRCWITLPINNIFTFSTKYTNQGEITNFPLNYASTQSKMLSIRYSLLVNQLSITENAYNFFNALQQQNIEHGNLYTRQPFQIRGNIKNVIDSDESVLGYFTVAGVTKKRIFVNRPPLEFFYHVCAPDFDLRFISFEPESSWPIYIDDIMYLGWARAQSNDCFDCRSEGGEITPPEFWEIQE